jgi:hypothetical protein
MRHPWLVSWLLLAVLPGLLRTEQPAQPTVQHYQEGKYDGSRLEIVQGIPILHVGGTPDEIGCQIANLTAKPLAKLLEFPREYVKHFGFERFWPALVDAGKEMLPQFPKHHLEELEAIVRHGKFDRDLAIAGNTFADIKKIGGCSAILVQPERSATKHTLLGRNLDWPTLGYLQEYSLVTVCKPKDRFAFVSVGFPGLVGCLSGMNEKGLCLAVLEVYSTNDGAPRFDAKGTPYALCFRRILEECATIAEAERLLRELRRTTMCNLAVCDREKAVVFEITSRTVAVRPAEENLCVCTNHFRLKELATDCKCSRFDKLDTCRRLEKIDLPDIAKALHAVHQGRLTMQTMIFEPATFRLHLAIGRCPSSALQLQTLDFAPHLDSASHAK